MSYSVVYAKPYSSKHETVLVIVPINILYVASCVLVVILTDDDFWLFVWLVFLPQLGLQVPPSPLHFLSGNQMMATTYSTTLAIICVQGLGARRILDCLVDNKF